MTAVHLLLFLALWGNVGLQCHTEQRAEQTWAAAVWAAAVIPPRSPLCSVTFQSFCPGASITCICSLRGEDAAAPAETPLDPGNSACFSNMMSNPRFRQAVMGMWFMGELNVHNQAVFPVLCLYKLFLLNLATARSGEVCQVIWV